MAGFKHPRGAAVPLHPDGLATRCRELLHHSRMTQLIPSFVPLQFSCASPSHGSPESSHEVWVCNSDGYVGQVCLLSIRKEPTVEACIAVCSARILCIASVPGLKRAYR